MITIPHYVFALALFGAYATGALITGLVKRPRKLIDAIKQEYGGD